MVRHFINFSDLTKDELYEVMELGAVMKAERAQGNYRRPHLGGRSVGMIFNKHSTRTRVSFECGITELGGHAVVLSGDQTQFSRGEPISHSARVLSRYLTALVGRVYGQSQLDDLARYGSIPIINALTDEGHPCQILTDIFTIRENFPGEDLEKITIAWIGDGNNMANSWIEAAGVLGFALNLACPEGYDPDPAILATAQAANPRVKLMRDPAQAVAGAWAVNTDVWASMGQEEEKVAREKVFKGVYLVDGGLMAKADPRAIFLHCLPAHIGEEVTEEVLESSASVIFDQAENRLHAQKGLLAFLIPASN